MDRFHRPDLHVRRQRHDHEQRAAGDRGRRHQHSGLSFELIPDGTNATEVAVGQIATVSSGGVVTGATVSSGLFENVSGSANGDTVVAGGVQLIFSGAQASGTVLSGGSERVWGTDTDTDTGAIVGASGRVGVYSGGTASGTQVNGGGILNDVTGGTTVSASPTGSSGSVAEEFVASGAVASATTLSSPP
jgi:autotransporter passenger strand-loop-strand repeat protein